MTPADRTPRTKNTRPPRLLKQKRAAASRRPAKALAKPKTGKAKSAGAKATRRGKAARVPKAGPARLKAPAPTMWEVLPEPEPTPEMEVAIAPIVVAKRTKPAKPARRAIGPILLVGLVVLALAALGLATQVTSEPNTGTIKVHDGPTADPATRNEPHVSGDFYVEGSNMAADSGGLFFFSWPPTGDGELVLETTWDADDAEPAFHFLAGPFELPCGHYRVGASNGPAEPEDFPGGMKKKTFWVECPDEEPEPEPEPPCGEEGAPPCPPPCGTDDTPPCPPPCGTDDTPPCPAECGTDDTPPCPAECGTDDTPPCPCGEPDTQPCPPPCGTDDTPPCPPPCGTEDTPPCPPTCGTDDTPPCPCGEPGGPPCPTCGTDDTPPCPAPEPEPELACPGFSAKALGDGSVEISWTSATGSDGTNIYRATGDGDFEYLTTVTGDVGTYVDTTTEPETAYAYYLTALFGNEESEDCEIVEVTAIPDLPTVLGAGLAMGGSLLAFALLSRRRKA